MSKAFDFAGGRLGYFVAAPAFVEAVMLVRLPYHLSALSQAAATIALRYSSDTLASVEKIIRERERVQESLQEMGFSVVPSKSNFLFFKVIPDESTNSSGEASANGDASRYELTQAAWQEFLDRGVLIRDVGVDGYLRVTIGLPTENDEFLSAAGQYASEHNGLR